MTGQPMFTFGAGDEHIGTRMKAFKAESGGIYRASFAWWSLSEDGKPDMGAAGSGKAPNFTGGSTNYIAGVGYILNEGPEYTKLAGEAPRERIVSVLILWPLNKKGELVKEQLADFEVKPWVLNGAKYRTLEQIHREFGFGEHDITIKCEENGSQFQKLTFSPCKENLYRQLLANPKAATLTQRAHEETQAIVADIQNFVGKKMSIQAIREKLSQGGGVPVTRDAGDNAVSSVDVESLVGGLLDQ